MTLWPRPRRLLAVADPGLANGGVGPRSSAAHPETFFLILNLKLSNSSHSGPQIRIFIIWAGITEKVFKVKGQRSRSWPDRPNAVMAEACISTAWSRGSLDFSVCYNFYFDIVWQTIFWQFISCSPDVGHFAHCIITMSCNINIKQDCLLI